MGLYLLKIRGENMDLKDNTEFFKAAVLRGIQKYEELKDDNRYFQFELKGVMEALQAHTNNDYKVMADRDETVMLTSENHHIVKVKIQKGSVDCYTFTSDFTDEVKSEKREDVIEFVKTILSDVRFIWKLDLKEEYK